MLDAGWRNPFSAPGAWRRANLHTHATGPEGRADPASRVKAFHEAGYEVLAITNHHGVTDLTHVPRPDSMLVLSGAELHPDNPFGGQGYHFVCLGISESLDAQRAAHPQEVIDYVNERGGVVFLAHPYWSRHTLRDLEPLIGYAGLEVYNTTCRGHGRSESSSIWDDILGRVRLCSAIATDDCHGPAVPGSDLFGGWTWIRTETLKPEAVLEALRNGQHYASCGPEILALSVEDHRVPPPPGQAGGPLQTHKIRVRSSPAREIFFMTDAGGARRAAPPGKDTSAQTIEEAEYVVPSATRYVRVEVVDHAGRKAWTNPVPFTW